ncbi:MAG: thiol:disulfide oxidoreductase [Alphaproteobacteria bacterium]|nr:thiol:disulfide oxidoreductase [Alphaproteobacteria bacterium]
MIDLYYWPTPNGWKVSIALEELGLPYTIKPINIAKGDQFAPEFLKIAPNNRIPAIVDHDGPKGAPYSLFESGAILLYLGEKAGKLIGTTPRERYEVLVWLMWQMGGVGPMFGQANHFVRYAPVKVPYAIERYTKEARRLIGVLDKRLAGRDFVAGKYSVADIAIFGWMKDYAGQNSLDEFGNVRRWYEVILARPAVTRGLAVGAELRIPPQALDDAARETLFGNRQLARR